MTDPTDKDREWAEQIVVTAMRSEIFRDALVNDTTRALEAVAGQGQADERARIVAALRERAKKHVRVARLFPQVAEESRTSADECTSIADALERGEPL